MSLFLILQCIAVLYMELLIQQPIHLMTVLQEQDSVVKKISQKISKNDIIIPTYQDMYYQNNKNLLIRALINY